MIFVSDWLVRAPSIGEKGKFLVKPRLENAILAQSWTEVALGGRRACRLARTDKLA
ncbi:MAG: hypothetical protein ACREB7_13510 [Sphingopyxis sp.]|uniref:hypothetical protein n=1 Tax=Sphingopyxis sp. TaxID=1908224 RepID=UPI003D6CA077